MGVWRYIAVERGERGGTMARRQGELAGATAADVRASLRRIGLQVIELKPIRKRQASPSSPTSPSLISEIRDHYTNHLRRRRRSAQAELYDGLATMLESGLPLLEVLDTLIASTHARGSVLRSMLVQVREEVHGGSSLGHAMESHPDWFDAVDIAMVEAGRHGGRLAEVLKTLAERQARADELGQKIVGVFVYPAVVTVVAIGVVAFLSTKTLPQLAGLLMDANVEVPSLTRGVIFLGSLLVRGWYLIPLILIALVLGGSACRRLAHSFNIDTAWLSGLAARWRPRLLRRKAVGEMALELAELARAGVPLVDGLRVLVPTVPRVLGRQLENGAVRLEEGQELSAALDDPMWFSPEFRRLLDVSREAGELEGTLDRLGRRYQREAHRLMDRMASLLEPATILILAVLVGTIVMAAVLPLLRLQEVL